MIVRRVQICACARTCKLTCVKQATACLLVHVGELQSLYFGAHAKMPKMMILLNSLTRITTLLFSYTTSLRYMHSIFLLC